MWGHDESSSSALYSSGISSEFLPLEQNIRYIRSDTSQDVTNASKWCAFAFGSQTTSLQYHNGKSSREFYCRNTNSFELLFWSLWDWWSGVNHTIAWIWFLFGGLQLSCHHSVSCFHASAAGGLVVVLTGFYWHLNVSTRDGRIWSFQRCLLVLWLAIVDLIVLGHVHLWVENVAMNNIGRRWDDIAIISLAVGRHDVVGYCVVIHVIHVVVVGGIGNSSALCSFRHRLLRRLCWSHASRRMDNRGRGIPLVVLERIEN